MVMRVCYSWNEDRFYIVINIFPFSYGINPILLWIVDVKTYFTMS